MSQSIQDDVTKLSPEKLTAGFGKTRIWMYVLLALILHVLVVGSTSVGYIRDTWIDPEGAEARRQAAARQAAAAEEPAPPAATTQEAATEPATQTAVSEEQQQLVQHKEAPVVQRITKTAKPEEIPTQPNDLGISIDQTNPQ